MFSQMTRMLDLLQDYCDYRSYQFVRFDGSTRCEDRHQHVRWYRTTRICFFLDIKTRKATVLSVKLREVMFIFGLNSKMVLHHFSDKGFQRKR